MKKYITLSLIILIISSAIAEDSIKYGLQIRIKGLSECSDCAATLVKKFKEKKLASRAIANNKLSSVLIELPMTTNNIVIWPKNEDIIKIVDTTRKPDNSQLKVTMIKLISSNRVLYKAEGLE
tara:strand:+ start:178 stop:546 length:369 start_codon:yes stop_codon:yes gene_type:complete